MSAALMMVSRLRDRSDRSTADTTRRFSGLAARLATFPARPH